MTLFRFAACLVALSLSALPGFAHDGIHINDPYARVISGSGVVYFEIENMQESPDTLLAARSDLGDTMLMTSSADANGVMQMRMVEGGFDVGAGQIRLLKSASDHVMLMGVTAKPKNGDTFTLTLTFANVGDVKVTVPVDNTRRTDPGSNGATAFDVMSAEKGHAAPAASHDEPATDHAAHDHTAHAAHSSGMRSVPQGPDEQVITQIMMAMFDKPEAPLTVNPVVVMGDSAIASWAQGDMAGRALLARRDGLWTIVLCGGPDLRSAEFLAANGVSGADHLSAMFNEAEDKLGADLVSRFSSFEGVVMISEPAHN